MRGVERRPLSRERTADTARPGVEVVRTAERRERPQYEGLFREPDWPSDEEDADV